MIDGQSICVPAGTTIMEAAKGALIQIPKLCYLKNINEIAACRVCVVEVEGKDKLLTSCNNMAEEGMVVYTNSPKVRKHRRMIVEMILSQHDCQCVSCSRSGDCRLQEVANDLNILEIPFHTSIEKKPWNMDFPLIRDSGKCIKCMRCIQVCDKIQSLGVWDVEGTGSRTTVNVSKHRSIEEAHCALCGQCITHCPVGALRERDDTEKLWDALADKKKVVVAQVAPAVRTAWGEQIGLSNEEATIGKLMDALKKMGADYVFDTSFTADLTIMEEGSEFVELYGKGELEEKPLFTSCCPGWVRFIKSEYPHLVKNLSSAKSPQQMFGAVMKTYFAKEIGVEPENMVTLSIMPCVAKKAEAEKELYYQEYAGKDIDIVLTTRELVKLMKSAHIDPKALKDIPSDSPMADFSGAGVIFGSTGGVMEAALRSAYFLMKGENPPVDAFETVRNPEFDEGEGIVEAQFEVDGIPIKTAVVSGLGNTRRLLQKIETGEAKYHFVEVMACPGGCVGGGGQPICEDSKVPQRGKVLYRLDEEMNLRFSHENKDVQKVYEDFFEKPLSHKAHLLLHTKP